METLLYTAEIIQEDGTYTLVVNDRMRDTVQTIKVPKKAVDKLPLYLSKLDLKQK
jgi:hypothetical protein